MRVYHNGVKKRLALLLALAMLALSLCGCGKAGPIDEGFWQQPSQHSYRAELSLDEAAKAVSGRMTVTYKNPTGAQMASLPFMLYPNAYAQVQTAPFQNDEMGKAYPGGFSEGGIVLTEVTADGQPVQTRLKNDDETLLEIDLPQPLRRKFPLPLPCSCHTAWEGSAMATARITCATFCPWPARGTARSF